MKKYRYIKASIDDLALQKIKNSIEDFVEYYYSCIGYEEYSIPDCKIELEGVSGGKSVYKISIEFDTVREQDMPKIWSNLDHIADSAYPEYEIFENFRQRRNENIFVGFVKEGNNKAS